MFSHVQVATEMTKLVYLLEHSKQLSEGHLQPLWACFHCLAFLVFLLSCLTCLVTFHCIQDIVLAKLSVETIPGLGHVPLERVFVCLHQRFGDHLNLTAMLWEAWRLLLLVHPYFWAAETWGTVTRPIPVPYFWKASFQTAASNFGKCPRRVATPEPSSSSLRLRQGPVFSRSCQPSDAFGVH